MTSTAYAFDNSDVDAADQFTSLRWRLYLDTQGGKIGGRDIVTTVVDEGGGRQSVRDGTMKLVVQDRVDVVVGTISSDAVQAVYPVITDKHIPHSRPVERDRLRRRVASRPGHRRRRTQPHLRIHQHRHQQTRTEHSPIQPWHLRQVRTDGRGRANVVVQDSTTLGK